LWPASRMKVTQYIGASPLLSLNIASIIRVVAGR
jgi:hypothetical protein